MYANFNTWGFHVIIVLHEDSMWTSFYMRIPCEHLFTWRFHDGNCITLQFHLGMLIWLHQDLSRAYFITLEFILKGYDYFLHLCSYRNRRTDTTTDVYLNCVSVHFPRWTCSWRFYRMLAVWWSFHVTWGDLDMRIPWLMFSLKTFLQTPQWI